MSTTPGPGGFANVGKSISIKGELSGSEDIYVVGPNGRVHANVSAKNVTVGGSLDGNIQASERTELRKTAVVNGDVQTKRIAIEEGAYFKGKLEILPEAKGQPGPGTSAMGASAAPNANPGVSERK